MSNASRKTSFRTTLTRSHLLVLLQQITRGFFFIPTLLAVLGVILAIVAVWIDRNATVESLIPFLSIQVSGARSVLSTIAGAMITVISLVYSLTLVVFTLAASNIGPRILETFTSNRVNQTTIGLLGATFLYALIVLYLVGDDEVPNISVVLAIILSATSFFWLIYFVHDVARRIMVDNEIGRTQRALRRAVDRLLADDPPEQLNRTEVLPDSEWRPVRAPRAGYVTSVDADGLVALARANDGFIEMIAVPGSFVVEGALVARLYGDARNCEDADVTAGVLIADARAPEGDIQFNVHLNVEIALRALSPGVNDSYTAISAIDHLSGSFARILQRGAPSPLRVDTDETPRLWLQLIGVSDIVGTALHPLRQAARENVFVTLHLIRALGRIWEVVPDEHSSLIRKHLRLIATDTERTNGSRDDRREIAMAIRAARRFRQYRL